MSFFWPKNPQIANIDHQSQHIHSYFQLFFMVSPAMFMVRLHTEACQVELIWWRIEKRVFFGSDQALHNKHITLSLIWWKWSFIAHLYTSWKILRSSWEINAPRGLAELRTSRCVTWPLKCMMVRPCQVDPCGKTLYTPIYQMLLEMVAWQIPAFYGLIFLPVPFLRCHMWPRPKEGGLEGGHSHGAIPADVTSLRLAQDWRNLAVTQELQLAGWLAVSEPMGLR